MSTETGTPGPSPRRPQREASLAFRAAVEGCTDLAALETQAGLLLEEARLIEGQLSNRNHVDADGQRVEGEAYWTWRNKARAAWGAKMAQYRVLKARIKALRMSLHNQAVLERSGLLTLTDPDLLLRRALALFWELGRTQRVAYSPSEYAVLDAIKAYLADAERLQPESQD